ncbi:conserved hypothetical protein [Xenorhabdus bovienii str. oregonense]|uniref:Uncharacterized protein n=1 Tax=Xenorhabdus bovienii str. oregonense TaxID=1398202 RepID=A0A077P4L3_XENBV|nr:conserved hypothetical protein [Xenorhabdus bovienii str. oregonense]
MKCRFYNSRFSKDRFTLSLYKTNAPTVRETLHEKVVLSASRWDDGT